VSISPAKFRYTLVAGTTAVVIGAGFTAVGLSRQTAVVTDRAAVGAPLKVAESPAFPADEADDVDLLLDDATPTPSASPSPTPTPKPSATTKPPTKPVSTPTKRKTKSPTPTTKPATAPVTSGSVVQRVLAHINAARAGVGLDAYTLDTSLSKAAALHNQLMIDGCGLEHQCAGEGDIGTRFSAQGVRWSSAGENIGFGSAGASNNAIVDAANGLTDSMLAEVPPDDGHRRNLISTGFERIGLSVVRDGKGVVWVTQDFVG
jgi:uncharacterized protein YkwD